VYAAPSRTGAAPKFLANASQGSRKDARDAVAAARAAQPGWAGATAYNRGQVLYRVAEVMEGRRSQFVDEVRAGEGVSQSKADSLVSQAIDRWVWYAGWSDKLSQILGGMNPVAGPFFNVSTPEPTGVVAVLAPQRSSLLGLVSVIAPVVVSGNTAVVISSKDRPLPAITLAECLATSDVPGGVVNLITGDAAEIGPWLASHRDVGGLDLTGAAGLDGAQWAELERAAGDTLKRIIRPDGDGPEGLEPDFAPEPSMGRMTTFLETKTVWHPKGR
jgi:acyl-CoA reductase-like NAD-dependent aldehyde dehydrogenase